MLLNRIAAVVLCLHLLACGGKQDFSRQETRYNEPVERRPDAKQAAKTLTSLGQAYLSKGQLDLAMDKLQRSLKLDPKYPDTHTVIAIVYEQIGKMAEAETHYRQAYKLSPNAGLSANNLGRFLCSQQRYADAEKLFVKAIEDPFYKTPETARVNRAVCARKSGNIAVATEQFREVLAEKPEDPIALWSMAELSLTAGDYMRARAFYERWLGGNEQNPESLDLGMRIESKLGNDTQVTQYRKLLIERFPDSAQATGQRLEPSP
ncbi:type IV pilus biogenesis/stability protein PilW [Ahniella affigens]|uniref:Type IV pilus biogenesis/stability protein PilW n=1 Tax=Ahniella affigens TaxID=2021234 RepID=A0A2P1PTK8_9GAMM|nr:type IV pilus biogenesis/stability protein PilW [Ahniella affigens]AVP98179.1 type IV pilus biogenesis/stability protein PilW [Ahniella affigens]